MKKFFKYSYLAIILLLLYMPIAVLIMFSFNSGDSIRNFQSWSWIAYARLFQQTTLWQSLSVTIIVAFVATLVATVLGTFAALGLSKTKKLTRSITLGVTNIPLVNADIVTAVALMLLFASFAFNFGIFTLILAHISFDIPYVIITVLPKIRSIDTAQLEASQDLGASPWYTLRKVVFPTIKPAIIAGAAIAFAMSFDDFIISYFTGGNAANVSVYIYSLKRIQPFVNAFSTLIIVIVAIIVISLNAYKIIRKQLRTRNEMIMNQTYRDKSIIKIEKNLNRHYLQLNMVKIPRRNKNRKVVLFQPITDATDEKSYSNFFHQKVKKHKILINNIVKLEEKLNKEQIWVQEIRNNIINKKIEKENKSKARREKFWFLNWPWRVISSGILILGVFSGAVALYVNTNDYDLTVANWGQYITPAALKGFEDQYHVKVKYSTFDANESLYAKLATTSYDVMVPSDYMVEKLAIENKIMPLNEDTLGTQNWNDLQDIDNGLVPELKTSMSNYKFDVKNQNKEQQQANLLNYCVPYFWGDLILVFNTYNDSNLLNELGVTINYSNPKEPTSSANWDVLQKAIKLNKNIVLNDDAHNIFALGLITLHYENQLEDYSNNGSGTYNQFGNTNRDYCNPHSLREIQAVDNWLKPIISSTHTRLQDDEIADTVAEPKGWDIAVMYNGDLLSAMRENPDVVNQYQIVRPYMGTNIWNDDMVIGKGTKHKQLAFDFIKYIQNYNVQIELSDTFGYTSPNNKAMNYVEAKYPNWKNWDNIYNPQNLSQTPPGVTDKTKGVIATPGYYNGEYHSAFGSDIQSEMNKLLATQGDNSVQALFIELVILLIIVVGFILLIFFIR